MTRRVAAGCAPALLGALDFGFLVVAAPELAAELEMASAYAWIFSAGSLAYGAVVMPAETLLGRFAASRVLAAGLAVAAAGIVLVAAAGGVAAALAGRVLFGAGTGAAAAPALVLLAGDDAAYARMGGAIALGFSTGVLLGAAGAWRTSLIAIAALAAAGAVVAARVDDGLVPRRDSSGALRLGAATAAAGAFLALVRAEPVAGAVALAVAAALAASAWRAVGARLPEPRTRVLVACAAGAATTMSGVSAMVLLGLRLGGTPSSADDLVLALFGLATLGAVGAARRLTLRAGPLATAAVGLAAQGLAILAVASPSPAVLVPSVALFGAAHVVANAGRPRRSCGTADPPPGSTRPASTWPPGPARSSC